MAVEADVNGAARVFGVPVAEQTPSKCGGSVALRPGRFQEAPCLAPALTQRVWHPLQQASSPVLRFDVLPKARKQPLQRAYGMLDRLRAQAPARAACAGAGAQPPPVPHQGVSLAALRAFAAAHAARSFTVPAHDGADAPQKTLPFGELTTTQVVAAIIKPATRCDKCSYVAMLGTRVRTA